MSSVLGSSGGTEHQGLAQGWWGEQAGVPPCSSVMAPCGGLPHSCYFLEKMVGRGRSRRRAGGPGLAVSR